MTESAESDTSQSFIVVLDGLWTSWIEAFDKFIWVDWLAIGVSAFSLLFSIIAFRKSHNLDKNSGVASIFLSLRSHYGDFYSRLHAGIEDLQYWDELTLPKSWNAYSEKQKLLAKEYWIISFNEWFVARKFASGSDISLWEEFYGPAIASGLRHYVLRRGLEEQVKSRYSFGRDEHLFIRDIYKLVEQAVASIELGTRNKYTNGEVIKNDEGSRFNGQYEYIYKDFEDREKFGKGDEVDEEYFNSVLKKYSVTLKKDLTESQAGKSDTEIADSELIHANNLIILLSKLVSRSVKFKFNNPEQAIASKTSNILLRTVSDALPKLHDKLMDEFEAVFGVDLSQYVGPNGKTLTYIPPVHQKIKKEGVNLHSAEALLVCTVAAEACFKGNYGIGAVVFDQEGYPIAIGGNAVLEPKFDSQAHAEMVAMNKLERRVAPNSLGNCRIVTSLEPCPMCFARLLVSGIGTVRYLAPDKLGGMIHQSDKLPDVWRDIYADRRDFGESPPARLVSQSLDNCSSNEDFLIEKAETFSELARLIFLRNREELDQKIKQRIHSH